MRKMSDGRGVMAVSATTRKIIEGDEDVTNWPIEELLRGQRKNKNGKWVGKRPTVVSLEVVNELGRRLLPAVNHKFLGELERVVKQHLKMIFDPNVADYVRIRAIEMFYDRVLGTAPKHVVFHDGPSKWDKLVAEVTILGNREQAIFAQEVEDDIEEGILDDSFVEEETAKEREEHLTAVESQRPTEVAPRHVDVAPTPTWPATPPPPPAAPERGPKGEPRS